MERPCADIMPICSPGPGLVHCDPRTRCAVKKSLQVKAGKLVVRPLADVGCKSRHRTGIARFEFGKGLEIGLRRSILILFPPKRLEGAQRLGPAAQDKISHRPAAELL